jgi:hypothetical protein
MGVVALTGIQVRSQPVVPAAAVQQLQDTIGNRVEALTVLGGDYGAVGGIYTFRGGSLADLSVSKLGAGGDVAERRPLGIGNLEWTPVLQGNIGFISAENQFQEGFLFGNRMEYDTFAVQLGGGARFYFTEHLSLAPTISGIYGHIENTFHAANVLGLNIKQAAAGTFVDWTLDTWSVSPGMELRYEWLWGRTAFLASSRYSFFHTESFSASSTRISVSGDSHTWENKLDVDVPLGWHLLGRELHTGGFFNRTELFGDISDGLRENHLYTANGRLVLDFLGKLWKLRWVGVGASYFWSDQFSGWSAGLDVQFQF